MSMDAGPQGRSSQLWEQQDGRSQGQNYAIGRRAEGRTIRSYMYVAGTPHVAIDPPPSNTKLSS